MKEYLVAVLCLATSVAGAQKAIEFSEACAPEANIEITAVGDVLLHGPLQIQAIQQSHRFLSLWSRMVPAFERSDLTYANLEGPAAAGVVASGQVVPDPGFKFDGKVYSGYPQFNYHPYLIADLKKSGIDIVSTANNHSLDRRSVGVNRTIQELDRNRVAYTGTRSTADMEKPWHVVTQAQGRNIAWLACTFSTNGIPDKFNQVLPCYKNPRDFLNLVHRLSKDPNIDAVIVTPHWGTEYQHKPHASQTWLGRQLIEAGATAVIGTHPHVVQPWEKFVAKDGREGFIIYSTGNFVSNQKEIAKRTSVLVQLNLVAKNSGKLKIRGVRFLPFLMSRTSRGLEALPVFRYDNSVPSGAISIWKSLYNENQRITSFDEDSVQKICQASQGR